MAPSGPSPARRPETGCRGLEGEPCRPRRGITLQKEAGFEGFGPPTIGRKRRQGGRRQGQSPARRPETGCRGLEGEPCRPRRYNLAEKSRVRRLWPADRREEKAPWMAPSGPKPGPGRMSLEKRRPPCCRCFMGKKGFCLKRVREIEAVCFWARFTRPKT
jgi:hypothetical protein